MVAHQTSIESRPADTAIETVARMEASVVSGDWVLVEQLAVRLRHIVIEVPESERQAVIVSVGHCRHTIGPDEAGQFELADAGSNQRFEQCNLGLQRNGASS